MKEKECGRPGRCRYVKGRTFVFGKEPIKELSKEEYPIQLSGVAVCMLQRAMIETSLNLIPTSQRR